MINMQPSIVIFLPALVVVTMLSQLSVAIPVCPIKSVGLKNENGIIRCWKCPECEHGMGLSVECGRTYPYGTKLECQPCKKGLTYSTTRDIGQCKRCQLCSDNEESKGECTEFEDSVTCKCKTGCYRDPVHRDCISCSTCCVGNRIAKVPECNSLCSFVLGSACAITEPISNTSKKQFNNTETNNEIEDMGTKTTQNKEQPTTSSPNLLYFALLGFLIPVFAFFYHKCSNGPTVKKQCIRESTESTSVSGYLENESEPMIAETSACCSHGVHVTDSCRCSNNTVLEKDAAGTSCMAQSSIVNIKESKESVLLQDRIDLLPSNITDICIKDLNFNIKNVLCKKLDIKRPMTNNFHAVAVYFSMDRDDIELLAQGENPTSVVLDSLGSQLKRVSDLMKSLLAIERLDILQWLLDELVKFY